MFGSIPWSTNRAKVIRMRRAVSNRPVEIGRRRAFDARGITGEAAGGERQAAVADMPVRVAISEAALALGRQIEILVRIAARLDRAAGPGDLKGKARRQVDGQLRAIRR